ncbi:unnamed protein product [Ectocarpus sp. CCAP 1310/34]|nr:unnamed protein product [Ectocarpus sp. CCAP 1310/34]
MLPYSPGNRGGGAGGGNDTRSIIKRVGCGRCRTVNLVSRRTFVFVFAAGLLGAALVLLLSAGDRDRSSSPSSSSPSTSATTGFKAKILSAAPRQQDQQELQGGGGGGGGGTSPSSTPETSGGIAEEEEGEGGDKPKITVRQAEGRGAGGGKVSVFVYDGVPELDHSWLVPCYRQVRDGVSPWQDETADMAQDMGEIWLHRAMLAHPWRVLNPEEADLFYVPMYPVLSMKLGSNRCGGKTHDELINTSVEYLALSSVYFRRFGGADHVLVCAWWNCRGVLGPKPRMLLRRTVVGINEKILGWTRWGCGLDKMVTIPYTASSVLTTSDMIGGRAAEDRDIPFFFVGTARSRPERQNLDVVTGMAEGSVIMLGNHQSDWGMNSTQYAAHISRSRFCFCPRGDTESSRRIFDAVAAGCTPIVTKASVAVLPFSEHVLNYSDFAVVVDPDAFTTRERVTKVVQDALSRSEAEVEQLREGGRRSMSALLYGVTMGKEMGDMRPFLGTATNFVRASYALAGGGGAEGEGRSADMWTCNRYDPMNDEMDAAPRTTAKLPPPAGATRQWLAETETIVNVERSLLLCAPPNTGSLQFRMLAKRMQGLPHWAVSNDRSLLFDREASGLELLDTTDGHLMEEIYRENGSGWIKIGLVRDPVTRLLSAYLDLADRWREALSPPRGTADDSAAGQSSNHDRRRLRQSPDKGELTGEDNDRHRQQGGRRDHAPLTGSEWDLLETIVDRRRRRWRRQRGPGPRQGEENERMAYEGLHDTGRGGSSGGGGVFGGEGGSGSRNEGTDNQGGANASGGRGAGWRLPQGERRDGADQRAKVNNDDGREVSPEQHPRRHREMEEEEERRFFWQGPGGRDGPGAAGEDGGDRSAVGGRGDGDGVGVPTFVEVVETLEADVWGGPVAFRPAVSLCGQRNSPFDSVIPFERLQKTSTELVKSLPGDIWEAFGKSGWGPEGQYAFMEFDYGRNARRRQGGPVGEEAQRPEGNDKDEPLPPRARDLFDGEDLCAWAEYYTDLETLETVGKIYELDYIYYRWYRLDSWRERLQACLAAKR